MRMSLLSLAIFLWGAALPAAESLPRIDERFSAETNEVPDFQKHLVPMLSKIGCNGRSCHGSFQGRGGFQLSLFGYNFKMDHDGLSERIDLDDPLESYALHKATNQEEHEGGQKIVPGTWEHQVFLKWIQSGAKGAETEHKLNRLEIVPSEIVFQDSAAPQPLQVFAVWKSGEREDVTPLCRFQSNDTSIASVSSTGVIKAESVGDTHVVVFYDNGVQPVPVMQPVSEQTGDNYPEVAAPTQIDKLVVEKLQKLGIVPAELCSDTDFLRRVTLDITGTLPSPKEIREFVSSENPQKRADKIDTLLETPAYAAWWATRFNDYTGNNVNQLNNIGYDNNKVTQEWYEWMRARVEKNTPYDEIVEGIVLAKSQLDEETYEEYCERMTKIYGDKSCESFAEQDYLPYFWARRNFQQPEDRAIGFAYTFLGIRIQCAQCHKHPFDQWTQTDFEEFQPLFSRTRYNNNGTDPKKYRELLAALDVDKNLRGNQLRRELAKKIKDGETVPFPALVDTPARQARRNKKNTQANGQTVRVLGGDPFDLNNYDEPRQPLMDWLNGEAQDLFARAFVNRVWSNYFHRGIVEPTDDLNKANPPSNAGLLDYLTQGFIEHDFDMKWLHREICNSRTYQLSWHPNETNLHDDRNFSRAVPRRMHAEVAFDALVQATAADDRNQNACTELDQRAIAIPGSAQGRRGNNYALTIFGKSAREENCDCERSTEPTLLQTLYLNNDSEFLDAIDSRKGWLNELAKEWNVPFEGAGKNEEKPKNYEEVLARYEKFLARLQEQPGQEDRAKEVRKKIKAYKAKYGDSGNSSSPAVAGKSGEIELQPAITEAYLRTVGRFPSNAELEVAMDSVQSAESPLTGMRDLLWALLNTKEFIVNH